MSLEKVHYVRKPMLVHYNKSKIFELMNKKLWHLMSPKALYHPKL
jgi:hypothetical protein